MSAEKKTEVTLPPLPSDESGGLRPASASVSDPSGASVVTGAPQLSSGGSPEAQPARLGYLIAGLAVLAILLAVIIARIAGLWHKPSPGASEPAKLPALSAPQSPPSTPSSP
jgi:hypothetical protein